MTFLKPPTLLAEGERKSNSTGDILNLCIIPLLNLSVKEFRWLDVLTSWCLIGYAVVDFSTYRCDKVPV
ncbi:hypothetical protein [Proteus sp. CA142267]|uniref:hypothetical protein n=1 Tax=Proteus TaxID=583 RepID=UPI000D68A50B|nr:hypothetical protein [Proteus sp. CA142267]